MAIRSGFFSDDAGVEERYIPNYEILQRKVDACRELGMRIVLSMGSYDMIHIGHALYIQAAKQMGDLLIVGVDSDEKIRARKKKSAYELRPVIPQEERVQMLSFLRDVDIITLKELDHPKWHLIKTVRPDVLQATAETYTPEQLKELEQYCGEVVVQERFAITSTSARIRTLMRSGARELGDAISAKIPELVQQAIEELNSR